MKKDSYLEILFIGLCLTVILLQFQIDIPLLVTTVRVCAADFMVPLILLFLGCVAPRDIYSQAWKITWLPYWFLAFTLWLGISLLIGYENMGGLSSFALANKFIGWLTLTGYFLIGGSTKNLTNDQYLRLFRVLLVTSWIIGLYCTLAWVLKQYYIYVPFTLNSDYRYIGFLENPNSFGYFNVFLLLLTIALSTKKILFSPTVNAFGLIISSICIVGSGSRGVCLSLIFGFVVLLIRKMISFQIVSLLALASIIPIFWLSAKAKIYLHVFNPIIWKFIDISIWERMDSIKLAFQWWLEQPIMGIGLGGFLGRKIQENILPFTTIHQTLLWLLTETGLIGLSLFLLFVFSVFKNIYKSSVAPTHNVMAIGWLAIIVTFAFISLTAEIMYQRYLWFFLGVILVQQNRSLLEGEINNSKDY